MSSLENAVYGASASIVANTIVYPLDLAKTVIQTQTKSESEYKNALDCLVSLYKKKGLKSWYKGISSSLLSSAVQSFTYFYWYSWVRKLWYRLKLSRYRRVIANTTPEELLLGIVAAALGQLFTNPISVISTRQQVNPEKNHSIFQTTKNILKEDGITGLWRGLKVSLVLTINPSITYASFERLKAILFPNQKFLHPHENFALGVVSKMLATIITQPLIISKVMLQKNDDPNNKDMRSFQSILRYLVVNEGWTSLWKGVKPQLLKGVLVQGFVFMFKDEITLAMKSLFALIRARRQLK